MPAGVSFVNFLGMVLSLVFEKSSKYSVNSEQDENSVYSDNYWKFIQNSTAYENSEKSENMEDWNFPYNFYPLLYP